MKSGSFVVRVGTWNSPRRFRWSGVEVVKFERSVLIRNCVGTYDGSVDGVDVVMHVRAWLSCWRSTISCGWVQVQNRWLSESASEDWHNGQVGISS